jgi:hypothetical protein
MAIVKKRNEEIANSLLLEAAVAVELPPAEVDEGAVVLQFENYQPFVPELLEELREGTLAETVPVIKDGSTFAVHGRTRTFWVKIWHEADSEMTVIKQVQVLSCFPSMRGIKVSIDDE